MTDYCDTCDEYNKSICKLEKTLQSKQSHATTTKSKQTQYQQAIASLQEKIVTLRTLLENHIDQAQQCQQYYKKRIAESYKGYLFLKYLKRRAIFGFLPEELLYLGYSPNQVNKIKQLYAQAYLMYQQKYTACLSVDFQQVISLSIIY